MAGLPPTGAGTSEDPYAGIHRGRNETGKDNREEKEPFGRDLSEKRVHNMSPGAVQERAAKGWLWTFVQSGVVLPLAFVVNVVVARKLGVIDYGRLAFLAAAMGLTSTFAGGGIGWATFQWSVAAWSRGEVDECRRLLSRLTGARLLVQFPIISLVGYILLRSGSVWLVILFICVTFVTSALHSSLLSLSVIQRTSTVAKISLIVGPITQVVSLGVALYSPTPDGVFLARYSAAALSPLIAVFIIDRRIRNACLHPRWPHRYPAGFWSFSTKFWLSGLFGILVFSRSEVFVFDIFGKTTALGIYAIAYAVAGSATTLVDASAGPLVAGFGSLLATDPFSLSHALLRAQRVVSFANAMALAVIVPPLVVIVPVLFGRSYKGVGPFVAALAVVATLRTLKHPVDALLNARRNAGVLLMSNVWSVLVDFGLAVVLIPLIGVWGAVVAGGAAQGLSMTFQVRAELKSQEMSVKEFIGANSMWVWGVACGGLAVLLGEVARTRIGVPLAVAIAIGVGTLSTSVIARATGGALRGNDLEAFVGSMPPRLRRTMRLLLRGWCPKAGGTAG